MLSLSAMARPTRSLAGCIAILGACLLFSARTKWDWKQLPSNSSDAFCRADVWAQRGQWRRKPGLEYLPIRVVRTDLREYYSGDKINILMPLDDQQQCLVEFGEWEQYCVGVKENIPRTNSLLSWEYRVDECTLRPFDPEQVLRSMVEDGGWSFIGDSLTREVKHPAVTRANAEARFCIVLSTVSPFNTGHVCTRRLVSDIP
jgi:hypothetical protein